MKEKQLPKEKRDHCEPTSNNEILESSVINKVISFMITNAFDVMKKYHDEQVLDADNEMWFNVMKNRYKINFADLQDVSIGDVMKNDVNCFEQILINKLKTQPSFEFLTNKVMKITKNGKPLKASNIINGPLAIELTTGKNDVFIGNKNMTVLVSVIEKLADLVNVDNLISVKNDVNSFQQLLIANLAQQLGFESLSLDSVMLSQPTGELTDADIIDGPLTIKIASINEKLFTGSKTMKINLLTKQDLKYLPDSVQINNIVQYDTADFKTALITQLRSYPEFCQLSEAHIEIMKRNNQKLKPNDIVSSQLFIKLESIENNLFSGTKKLLIVELATLTDLTDLNSVTITNILKHDLDDFRQALMNQIKMQPNFFMLSEDNVIITNSNNEALVASDIETGKLGVKFSSIPDNPFFTGQETIFIDIKTL